MMQPGDLLLVKEGMIANLFPSLKFHRTPPIRASGKLCLLIATAECHIPDLDDQYVFVVMLGQPFQFGWTWVSRLEPAARRT